ncbi:unnamed protein product (macronuclear) [Paramecium tetraurelia]|uniref:G domain-containing protein n=1 Tax=Paramecium tetraurelia TaxID=5888 RepID=A0BG70_PARTE|nr:uncharacterized protein GSPATT00028572001 [Paramecium tetraurelia]CAK57537.1 unnamed protein product [Paramecium tetraurelia]|eukprot:XP_001424935.1 hypothetical protein (macronuclear) [Paramecium tetraurelia strain d4-2]
MFLIRQDLYAIKFEKELLQLYKDILLMIEFPINLNNEIEVNQNVSLYLESLKTFIADICIILSEKDFYKMAEQFKQIIYKNRQKMIQCLNNIVQENTEFEIYLRIKSKDKPHNEVFNQLLQFKFQLHESDIEILEKLKMYQYNEDVIKKTLYMIILDINQQFKQFDLYLPQSLAYVKRIIPQQQNANLDKPYVFVLGMTKVGKSTLLNILNNPENIIITQDKKFDVKQKNNKILLSHKNSSSTFQTENLEIGNFLFVDTPGIRDTYDINRGINHFNIFNSITRVSQQILLLMIDGEQLQTTKNDLIDSITLINNMLGDQNDDKYLENFIIPVFTKIRNASTMEQIIRKWQTETMKDITDQKQLNILKIIKNAIDQENYIKIYSAERYEIHEKVQQLKLEIKSLKDQICEFDIERVDEFMALQACLKTKIQEQKLVDCEGLFQQKIKQIKEDVLRKCENILKMKEKTQLENSDINQSLNFELQLTPELKHHIEKLLPHRNNFYQHLSNLITNNFIAKMLFDGSISINEKFLILYKIKNKKMNTFSDISQYLINQQIQDQINELNHVNNIISKFDDQNQDPQKVNFENFQFQLKILLNLFREQTSTLINGIALCNEKFDLPFTFQKKLNMLYNAIIISKVCEKIFINSVLVTQKEIQKQATINLLKVQQNYISFLEKTRK